MSDIAIKVENISKKYQIGENKTYPTLRDKLMELPNRLFKGPKKTKEFWALRDVSFEVKKGEVVGIIGRNGAGKSTMLKILARITEPTSGKVTMYGRVASMLEVGTGFNPELTGRENIYLNGAIIGMKKSEINTKFNDIVEFSGVGKFLDTPVKHYSSGMYVRLAFAVAAHLDADILLVDEVLAVGDAEFQKKCLGKMSDIADSGKTVIFVSHDVRSILTLCSQAILLKNGQVVSHDNVQTVVKIYNTIPKNRESPHTFTRMKNEDNSKLITKVILQSNSKKTNQLNSGSNIKITVQTNKKIKKKFALEIILKNVNGEKIGYMTSMIQNGYNYYKGGDTIIVDVPKLSLSEGRYWIDLNCRQYPSIHIDRWIDEVNFLVLDAKPFSLPHSISISDGLGSIIFDEVDFNRSE